MKRSILILCLSLISFVSSSQNVSVEKSIFNVQTGFLGLWVNNEARLSNRVALRSELGLGLSIFMSDYLSDIYYGGQTGYVAAPMITLEPRWYYNLDKRAFHLKNITGNSGNFLTLRVTYFPSWFTISNNDYFYVVDQIQFIPKWGMRRMIGNHFNYEVGAGIGLVYVLKKEDRLYSDDYAVADLHLRVGWKF